MVTDSRPPSPPSPPHRPSQNWRDAGSRWKVRGVDCISDWSSPLPLPSQAWGRLAGGTSGNKRVKFPLFSPLPGLSPRFPRQHLRSQLPCPFGARAQAGQRPRPSHRAAFHLASSGVPQPRASRPPQAPGRHEGAGGGSGPLSRVRGPSRGPGRLGLSWRKEWEEGAGRTGGSASGRPISMRPRSAHHGNRSPSAAPARQPRAQCAPLLPQVAARAGRARSHGYARAGTHSRGAWGRLGASRGRQVRWAARAPLPPPVGVCPGAPE